MKISSLEQILQLMPPKVIRRSLTSQIIKDFDKPEMQILYGPRQVGKSTLMYQLMLDKFETNQDMFYFNLDQPDSSFDSAENFLAEIVSRSNSKNRVYIFIDEIQRKSDAGLFLKYLYDRRLNWKFVLTGSASLQIKNIVREPLTGRKFEYFLAPLDLKEILAFQGIDIRKISQTTPSVQYIFEDYLLYGGYPDVVLKNRPFDKIQKLKEISRSYITRDLTDLFQIRASADLENTTIYLAQNISAILSKENIAKTVGISVYQVNSFIEALTKSFIIEPLRPFYKNPVKEISHRPKMYFIDNGIRNILLQKTTKSLIVADKGLLFEQTIFQILRQKNNEKLRYWRTINQTEVDFVMDTDYGLEVYEAKYDWSKPGKPKNVQSFCSQYKDSIASAHVITATNFPLLYQ
ncbi:MAG: ATP-binding protein [Candidatus Roizmanbacteria bacterium]|nr:ATP-binding protein [Candidatus Roizmanbacteria bacterium]